MARKSWGLIFNSRYKCVKCGEGAPHYRVDETDNSASYAICIKCGTKRTVPKRKEVK